MRRTNSKKGRNQRLVGKVEREILSVIALIDAFITGTFWKENEGCSAT
jgi:hypothetical protein